MSFVTRARFIQPILLAAATLAVAGVVESAKAEDDFYKGKVVTLMVGFPAGGGYDAYARVVARHMPRHIPGEPRIIVQNMPGAGSLNLTNNLYALVPKDGTVIGSIEAGIPFEALYKGDGVRFDPLKFTWIGGLNLEVTTCQVWHTSKIKKFEDLITVGAPFGGTGSGAPPIVETNVINEAMGAKIKLIPGYPGTPDIYSALERGEIEGACGINWSSVTATRGNWIKEHKLIPLVQIAAKRHPDLPDVRLITEVARNEDERQLLQLLVLPNEIGRPYLAPPGVPADRTKTLRTAFQATMKDAAFLAEAKRANLPIDPVTGEQIEKVLADAYRMPAPVIQRMAKARK